MKINITVGKHYECSLFWARGNITIQFTQYRVRPRYPYIRNHYYVV